MDQGEPQQGLSAPPVAGPGDRAVPPPAHSPEDSALRLAVDSIREGFGLLAPDFTILDLNAEALRIDGRPRADLIGRSHWRVYPGTEDGEVGRLYKKAMAERTPVALEHRYDWTDGRVSWFETRAYPVENGCIAVFYRDVTERRLASERLRTSEKRFKAAVSAIEGVLWTNNAAGEMVGEQAGWAALTGQSFAEYQGYGWSRAVHPDDAQPTIDAWRAAVAARAPFVFEHRVRRHDGVWRLCAIRATPVLDDEGGILEWVGVHRDITDTRANDLRLHQIADTIHEVLHVRELDSDRVSYVSRAYEEIWGRTRQALYDDPESFLAVVHPDDRWTLHAAMARHRAAENTDIEYRLRRDDGQERIIRDRAFVTRDPVSGALRVVGAATDITDQRHAEALLARNAETFTNLVVSNPFGIYVVDADFRLLEISQGARAVFAGIDPLIGRPFDEIIATIWPQPFADEVVAHFRRTLETGAPYVSPSTIEQRANIDAVEAYDWRIERIALPDGRYGVVCYFYDLSERNAYEARLREALADKDLLAREIDHRVKNSLTVVGSLLAMQRNASASAETRAALDEAAARVTAVARVHEGLHRSHELGVVAFGDYLQQMCVDLGASMQTRGMSLHCRAAAVELAAEPAMTLALVTNELVTNAFKHGGASGATAVEVTLEAAPGRLVLTVADNGAGMATPASDKAGSLGFKLIAALARQIDAVVTFPAVGAPARFVVTVSLAAVLGSDEAAPSA